MTANPETTLAERMQKFVLPYTERELGAKNVTVDVDDAAYRVVVRLGFPLKRSREVLIARLDEAVQPLSLDRPVEFTLESKIAAHSVQPSLKPLPGIRNVIAVTSGKGGVGKSTVAANLALALAQEGARVGILDADIYGPSQPRILNLMGQRPETKDGKTMLPLTAYGIVVMSIGFLVEDHQAVAWRGPMVTSALNQLLGQTDWGELDYLIVDMPPGTGDIQLTLAQRVPVSGAVVVTTPQEIALADARKGLEMFNKVKVPLLGVIENMAIHVCSACGHEEHLFGSGGGARLAKTYGLPLLASLPLEGAVREQTDAGRPTVESDPDGAAARAFRDAALRMAGELAATGKDYKHLFPSITVEDKQ
jgi:ATP-binding protein involved in chromosome partitioning